MKVLIACEYSGIVRTAFSNAGHDAISCDLLPTDIPGKHYKGNVLDIIDNTFDLMIAHPPCTWLCQAMRINANRNDRPYITSIFLAEREKAFNFFLQLYSAPISKICIENPIGYINSAFRKPDQIIRPYNFGHPYRKDVCLWLKGLPPLISTAYSPGRLKLDFWSTKRNQEGKSLKSKTFPGIARAMASQWGPLLL